MKSKEEIINNLYAAYGSDSGILFGIRERPIVEAIIDFFINHSDLHSVVAERDEYRKALETIAANRPSTYSGDAIRALLDKYTQQ